MSIPATNGYAFLTEAFNAELFKADGVTPDTFTPEPGSVLLTMAGLVLLLLRVFSAKHF